MASFQARIRDSFSRLVFPELVVDAVRDVSAHFRQLRVSAPALRSASVSPGDKLQIMIVESGPRTYSPFAHDPAAGTVDLLAYVHGDTPGSAWIRELTAGTRFRGFGPRGSLALASLSGPVVLFGDETSFGVATALTLARQMRQTRQASEGSDGLSFVFECSQPDEARAVLGDLGLARCEVVAREPGLAHARAVDGGIRAALARHPGAHLVLTGHAQMIQAVRASLKKEAPAYASQKVKAYWADGKRGLD
jgi:ferric-chelate reductase (NADPH)